MLWLGQIEIGIELGVAAVVLIGLSFIILTSISGTKPGHGHAHGHHDDHHGHGHH